jgi:hypothetical protein
MNLIFNKIFNYIKKYQLFDTNDLNEKIGNIGAKSLTMLRTYPKIR